MRMYNPCEMCQGTEHKLSNAGGMRLVCLDCGRNTVPNVWNDYNHLSQEPGVS